MAHKLFACILVVGTTLAIAGCSENSPLATADGRYSDLSGTYVKDDRWVDLSMKFITVSIEEGTIVNIEQEGGRYLSIRYKTGGGHSYDAKLDLSSDEFKWDKGALIYWHKALPKDWILPGYAKQTRAARVYKSPEGDLVIESSFTEDGLMLFVVPFRDYYETKLVLRAHEKAP